MVLSNHQKTGVYGNDNITLSVLVNVSVIESFNDEERENERCKKNIWKGYGILVLWLIMITGMLICWGFTC